MKHRHPDFTRNHLRALKRVIRYFESQVILAQTLGIGRAQITHWMRGRELIPLRQALRIERMLQKRVTAYQLRPDILVEDLRISETSSIVNLYSTTGRNGA